MTQTLYACFMNDKHEELKPSKFIREICKGKTEEELLNAEENFREYLLVIKGMCDRIDNEEKRDSDFDDL